VTPPTEDEIDLIVMREMLCDAMDLPRSTPVKELTVKATCALFLGRSSVARLTRSTELMEAV
jgi:hypothetical protein